VGLATLVDCTTRCRMETYLLFVLLVLCKNLNNLIENYVVLEDLIDYYYLSFPGLENQNRHFLKVKNVTDFYYIYFINFSLNDIIRLLKNNIIFIMIL
jgi:hypothetical protein